MAIEYYILFGTLGLMVNFIGFYLVQRRNINKDLSDKVNNCVVKHDEIALIVKENSTNIARIQEQQTALFDKMDKLFEKLL